jgi:hypothetical protein
MTRLPFLKRLIRRVDSDITMDMACVDMVIAIAAA